MLFMKYVPVFQILLWISFIQMPSAGILYGGFIRGCLKTELH